MTGAVDGPDGGDAGATVTAAYWDSLTTGRSQFPYGEALETPQLTGRAAVTNLESFDFATTWIGTESYPRLAWSVDTVSVTPADVGLETGETTPTTVTTSFADDGTVTAVGAGTATITTTVGDETATTRVTVPDRVAPTADAGGDRTATPGSPVSFDASGSDDNVGIGSYEWTFGDGTTATGETVTHSYDASETYTETLTVTDASGNDATDSLRVDVREDSDDTDDSDDSDDSTSSTTGVSASGSTADETTVSVERIGDRWTVTVSNARADTPVEIDVGDSGDNVSVTGLRLNTSRDGDFALTVTTSPGDWNGDVAVDTRPIGTVNITHSIDDSDIENVTFRFRVDSAAVDPSTVTLYRRTGGNWTELPTTFVNESAGSYSFQATAPGLSVFTIGAETSPQPAESETPVGTVTPTEAPTAATQTTGEPTTTTGGSGPGMGVLAALLAVALVALRARRRTD